MLNRLPFDDLHGFCGWLQAAGAEVLPRTNPWEILRVRTSEGTLVAYKNSKGRQSWPPRLDHLRRVYLLGRPAPDLSPTPPALQGPMVTIFADASLDHATGAAGWGAWLKRHGRAALLQSGPVEHPIQQSDDAELWALANALISARDAGFLAGAASVMFQSDSIAALNRILAAVPTATDRPAKDGEKAYLPRRCDFRPVQQSALDSIAATTAETGIAIFTRHVKGHQRGGGRQWVNRECDRLAKQAMRLRKQEIEGNENAES